MAQNQITNFADRGSALSEAYIKRSPSHIVGLEPHTSNHNPAPFGAEPPWQP